MNLMKVKYTYILAGGVLLLFFLCNITEAYAQLMRGLRKASEKELSSPPQIIKLPAMTTKLSIKIQGKTFPGAFVSIEGGSSTAYGVANPVTGEFEIEVFLNPESMNKLEIKAIDREGRLTPSATVEVVHSVTPPEAPVIYDYQGYTNQNMVDIKGKTRPGYKIVAYGGKYPATSRAGVKGDFEISVYLNPNIKNSIRIASVDPLGNLSPFTEVNIVHDTIPPDPPKVLDYPTRSRKTIVKIKGEAEANSTVVVEGGKGVQKIGCDEFGKFEGKVEILKFALSSRVNHLKLYAEDRAGNRSEPTEVLITHVHFFRKHMLFVKTGLHFYPRSDFLNQIRIEPVKTSGPSLEVSYDYIFKAPFSIGIGAGTYSSLGNSLPPQSGSQIFLEVYIVSNYVFVKPAFHFMLEKFDIYTGAGGGYLHITKIERQTQAGESGISSRYFSTWIVRFYAGINYYLYDWFSLGIEDSYSLSWIGSFNETGDSFDPGGNIISATVGFHF